MRTGFKKAACAALAAVLAVSLCGCDRGYIMTVDGMDIRNGIYLSFMGTAYSNAQTALNEQKAAESEETSSGEESAESNDSSDTSEEESLPLTEEQIDGKSGSQWIKDETMDFVLRFVAVQRKCEELDIKLSDEEIAKINDDLSKTWDNENQYLQYIYGYNTMGEYYESQGIGKESMREIRRVNELETKLFEYYYDEGGELEVDKDTFNKHLKENYAVVKMHLFAYKDASGKALESDEQKNAVKEKAQKYADRLNNGDKAIDVFYDIELEAAEESAKAKAETDYKADNEEKLSKEDWIKQQVEAANITKKESEDDLDTVIKKSSSSLCEEAVEYVFDAPEDGKATVFVDDADGVYLFIKTDITKQEEWLKDNRTVVLSEIEGDNYREMLDIFAQNYEVDADSSLINDKYSPEKFNN